MEPDEDQDDSRGCIRCGKPRWSRAGQCKYCASCGEESMYASILARKYRDNKPKPPPKKRADGLGVVEAKQLRALRRAELRAAGASNGYAGNYSRSATLFEQGMRQLREHPPKKRPTAA